MAVIHEEERSLRERMAKLGTRLQVAVGKLGQHFAAQNVREQKSLAVVLGLSASAVSRLLSAARQGDPIAVLNGLPGTDVLSQLVRGAAKAKVPGELVTDLREAVEQLDELIYSHIGDRIAFEAILSEWVLETETTVEARHRALAFKAMSVLKGVQVDISVISIVIFPSPRKGEHQLLAIDALLGCRRIKPSGVMRTNQSVFNTRKEAATVSTLHGESAQTLQDVVLTQFCTVKPEQMSTVSHDTFNNTSIIDLPLQRGLSAGSDLVTCFRASGVRTHKCDEIAHTAVGTFCEPPIDQLVLDAWLHDDVWPGVQPYMRIYDTAVRGPVTIREEDERAGDRMASLEAVQPIGRGANSMRMNEYARYPELMSHVCEVAELDPEKLRGFRLKVRQPVYGSQVEVLFDLP